MIVFYLIILILVPFLIRELAFKVYDYFTDINKISKRESVHYHYHDNRQVNIYNKKDNLV